MVLVRAKIKTMRRLLIFAALAFAPVLSAQCRWVWNPFIGSFDCAAPNPLTGIQNAIGTTSTDGISLTNTTAAAAGAQQFSPRIRFLGNGWKTNATAASQSTEWWIDVEPAQDQAGPDNILEFVPRLNNVVPQERIIICQNGNAGNNNAPIVGIGGIDGQASPGCGASNFNGIGTTGSGNQTNNIWSTYASGVPIYNNAALGIILGGSNVIAWTSTGVPGGAGSGDTGLVRESAGIVGVYDGSGTATNFRDLQARSIINGGALSSITGCSISAHAGGNNAGTYTSGTTGTCTVTLTFTTTAPTGWSCQANDQSTVADLQHQTPPASQNATTAVITGTTASGDVINYNCTAY